MIRLRRIFLRKCELKIRRIAGYATDFWLVLSEKKTSKISSYFFKAPYYKGIKSNGMIERLDIEKIAAAVKDQLYPLYMALGIDQKLFRNYSDKELS